MAFFCQAPKTVSWMAYSSPISPWNWWSPRLFLVDITTIDPDARVLFCTACLEYSWSILRTCYCRTWIYIGRRKPICQIGAYRSTLLLQLFIIWSWWNSSKRMAKVQELIPILMIDHKAMARNTYRFDPSSHSHRVSTIWIINKLHKSATLNPLYKHCIGLAVCTWIE